MLTDDASPDVFDAQSRFLMPLRKPETLCAVHSREQGEYSTV